MTTLSSPTTHYLDLPSGRLAYDDTGSGPLVVCVPGMGDLRQEYRFLQPRLVAAGYRVVTMDLIGMGDSSAQAADASLVGVGRDLLALIRHLQAGPAVLLGTSMAAGAAVWAAAEAPDLVSRLVLIGPFVRGRSSPLKNLLYFLLFNDLWGGAAWPAFFASLYPSQKPADWSDYLARLRANLRQPGRLKTLRRMIYASKDASESRLSQVHQPTLILMGSRDPDFPQPATEAAWIAAHLPATVTLIEGAGHYPQVEFPDQTAAALVSFLAAPARSAR